MQCEDVPIVRPDASCKGDCWDAYQTFRALAKKLGYTPDIEMVLYMTASSEYAAYVNHEGVQGLGKEGLARSYYESCYDQDKFQGCQGNELYKFLSGYQPWMGYSGTPDYESTTPSSRA